MGVSTAATPDFVNAPAAGRFVTDQGLFEKLTERNRLRLNAVTPDSPVFGTQKSFDLPNRGIYSAMKLFFTATSTVAVGTGGVAATSEWPYNLISNIQVIANGTSLVNCSGLDLWALRQMRTAHAADGAQTTSLPNSNGATNLRIAWDIPFCVDPVTLVGAVFAQSDATKLYVNITFASQARLATLTGTATWTLTSPQITPHLTIYDVPLTLVNNVEQYVVPDLSRIYSLQANDTNISANGEQAATLTRANGQLLRVSSYAHNGTNIIDPATASKLKWNYGQNQTPREYNPIVDLLDENAKLYNGLVCASTTIAAGQAGYAVLDFVSENPRRDAVIPRSVVDLKVIWDLGALSISGGKIHTFEESLVSSGVAMAA